MDNEKLTINKKQLKELVADKHFRMSSECFSTANEYLLDGLDKATQRAEANGRKTVYSRDW